MMTVQALLRRRGWSEERLAAHLGLAPGVVRGWEEGRSDPNDRQLAVVARVLGVPEQVLTDPVVLGPGPAVVAVRVPRVPTAGMRSAAVDDQTEGVPDGDATAPRARFAPWRRRRPGAGGGAEVAPSAAGRAPGRPEAFGARG